MQTSRAGIDLIKKHEGLRLDWYFCPANKPTIGYGHVILAHEQHLKAGPITEAQAEAILRSDLQKFEKSILRLLEVPVTQYQFDALVSFTFNVGPAALSRSTLLRKLNAGDEEGAAKEFNKWIWATVNGEKRKLTGLARRRVDEASLFRGETPVELDRS